jgi:RNA polymerase sigma factor (sigma-70 family)
MPQTTPTQPTSLTEATGQFLRVNAERFVGRLRLEPDTASDCVAEFLAKGVQVREKTPEAARPLLLVSGRNAVWDFLRVFSRQVKREVVILPDISSNIVSTNATPEMLFQQHNVREIISEAVAKLAHSQQSVWHQHIHEGLSFGEIAAQTGSTENATRQRFFNARQQIQKHLLRQGWSETLLREYVAEAARRL